MQKVEFKKGKARTLIVLAIAMSMILGNVAALSASSLNLGNL